MNPGIAKPRKLSMELKHTVDMHNRIARMLYGWFTVNGILGATSDEQKMNETIKLQVIIRWVALSFHHELSGLCGIPPFWQQATVMKEHTLASWSRNQHSYAFERSFVTMVHPSLRWTVVCSCILLPALCEEWSFCGRVPSGQQPLSDRCWCQFVHPPAAHVRIRPVRRSILVQ